MRVFVKGEPEVSLTKTHVRFDPSPPSATFTMTCLCAVSAKPSFQIANSLRAAFGTLETANTVWGAPRSAPEMFTNCMTQQKWTRPVPVRPAVGDFDMSAKGIKATKPGTEKAHATVVVQASALSNGNSKVWSTWGVPAGSADTIDAWGLSLFTTSTRKKSTLRSHVFIAGRGNDYGRSSISAPCFAKTATPKAMLDS